MIDAQLHFESICGLGVGTHHDASVVYQNVYLFLLWKTTEARLIKKQTNKKNILLTHEQTMAPRTFIDQLSKRFDGLGVGQIELPDDQVFISRVFQNVCPRLLGPLQVPARHHDAGP